MIKILITLTVFIFVFISIISIFKRKKSFPCPSWLSFVLENPYMESVSGSTILISRMEIKPGMRILDIGCGPGRLAIPLAKHVGENGKVLALDIQEKMLQKLEKRIKENSLRNIEKILGGAGEGKIKEQNSFDRAILVTVLGEIPNKKQALEEIFKALKPEGILSITEVFPDPHFQRQGKVLRLTVTAGFTLDKKYGNMFVFTMNFIKPKNV